MDGGTGFTTPQDLAVIFRNAISNPMFAQITSQPVGHVSDRAQRAAW